MYRPMQMPQEPDEPTYEWRLSKIDGGVCYEDLEFKLNDNQSPYMRNLWFMDRALSKRWGQEWVLAVPISADPPLAAYEKLYKGKVVFAQRTFLYTLDLTTKAVTQIFSGLTANKGSFTLFNDILYYRNGAQYIQWNGTTASAVVGYIPTIIVNSPPAGGGTTYQAYNYLSAGFKTQFSGTAGTTVYQLPQSGLDATLTTCQVYTGGAWVTKVEGVDYTVNRTTGAVTFNVAPGEGTNNVIITAYKTVTGDANNILKCNIGVEFGGENTGLTGGTRIFVAGNPDYPNQMYYSDLLDPTYYPYNNYALIGTNSETITTFGKQYNILVAFKPTSLASVKYKADSTATAGFTLLISTINASIGCDMPDTVKLINNRLTWANTYAGVHTLASTDIQDERNVQPISRNINGNETRTGLLSETMANLQAATSVDFKGKYWLCVGSNVYMWDYTVSPYVFSGNADEDARRLSWFPLDTISAGCWVINGQDLYYGDRTTGNFAHFIQNKNDFGVAMPGVWRSKVTDFGYSEWLKNVLNIWFSTASAIGSEFTIRLLNEAGETLYTKTVPPGKVNSFSWKYFSWAAFTWAVNKFAHTLPIKAKLKKIAYFQIEFSNSGLNYDLSIFDLVAQFVLDRRVK